MDNLGNILKVVKFELILSLQLKVVVYCTMVLVCKQLWMWSEEKDSLLYTMGKGFW